MQVMVWIINGNLHVSVKGSDGEYYVDAIPCADIVRAALAGLDGDEIRALLAQGSALKRYQPDFLKFTATEDASEQADKKLETLARVLDSRRARKRDE